MFLTQGFSRESPGLWCYTEWHRDPHTRSLHTPIPSRTRVDFTEPPVILVVQEGTVTAECGVC